MQIDEIERLRALKAYNVLDTATEARFDRITDLAADLFGMPISLISLLDEERQWFKSHYGLTDRQTPRGWAFCDHAIRGGPGNVFVVSDAAADPRFSINPLVVGPPDIRFYAGAPLATAQGHCIGTLCVIDTEPHPELTDVDKRRLLKLAQMVMDELESTKANQIAQERLGLLQMAEAMSGVGYWRYEIDGDVIKWSDEVYRIHGVDPKTFDPDLNRAVEFFPPEDQAVVNHLLQRAVAHQEGYSFQLRLMRADGELRNVVCKATCELDGAGATSAVTGVFQDVTEQVRHVDRIKRSEERYRLLADHMGDVITRVKLDGTSGYISPAIETLLGFKPEEMRGQTAQAFVHVEDRPLILTAFAELARGLERKTVQHRASHKDGRTVWVETQFTLVRDDGGQPAEIVAVIRDISARKAAEDAVAESEARYRLLADNANDMIARMKPSSEIMLVTPGCQTVLGYSPAELIGTRTIDLMHRDDLKHVFKYFAALEALGPGGLLEPYQFRARHKDGHWIWLEGQPKMFFDDKTGLQTETQDVVRDVTSRKMLEQELQRARIEAEAATVVKSEFLSNMSHELRTPLTSIIGFTAFLARDPDLSDKARQFSTRIAGASQVLLAIINDILDFSKLEAGQVEIERRPVDPHALLTNALQMMEPQATAKSISLSLVSGAALPAQVMLDDARVRQVLLNLVGNALKFTERGSVTLTANYLAQSGRLRCVVTDTGAGVPPDRLERLFKRFSQVDASTTRVHGGTGLGLAICKALVEAMGGEIGATSVVGEGSAFWFELPCPLGQEAGPPQVLGFDDEASRLRGLRLLVVDDNANNRELLRLMLSPHGVSITDAKGGGEAMTVAGATPFDLILMDIRMPDVDGPTAAAAIRAGQGPNAMSPILAFTADVIDAGALSRLAELFDGCVAKPVVPGDLLSAIVGATSLTPEERRAAPVR